MENVKVSIIVPVYNVIDYLDRCIRSLTSQTYDNIEILLIDDGSTDGSGNICDRYADQYANIISIHKENGGLSDARNYAVQYVTGDYITYVDSDDYVDIDMVEKMIGCLHTDYKDPPVDIVICRHDNVSIENVPHYIKHSTIVNDEIIHMTNYEALREMCYEINFGTTACAKLYKRNLIDNKTFPKRRLYEDLASVYKLIGKANGIAFINYAFYHYVQRSGSIRRSKWDSRVFDVILASEELLDYVENNFPKIYQDAIQRYFFSANELYVRAFCEKEYAKIIKPIKLKLASKWGYIAKNPNIRLKQKIRYWMLIHTPVC